MVFLQVKELSKKNGERTAVDAISFSMEVGQKIAIAGETGSGKTTLLKMIGGFIQPDSGEVLFENKKVLGPLEQLIPGHPFIAYLSQHFELRNNYAVHELLEMASKLEETEAQKIFSVCQVEHLLQRRTNELSGGEKQRIVLAMQLIKKPKLLLLDEPFSNLDAIHERTIQQVIHDVCEQFHTSCILVSHDGKDVLSWADTILVMKEGQLIQKGTPQEIYHQPATLYCAGLFGSYNVLSPALQQQLQLTASTQTACIRPEKIQITSSGIAATVQQVRFYGMYEQLFVTVKGAVLELLQPVQHTKPGDEIFISLAQQDVFYC
jgi:ABC-type sugar transport system ATPase subunit